MHISNKLLFNAFLVAASFTFILAKNSYTPKIADPLMETWRWTNYAELNGKGTRCIVEDNSKCVWFGVNQGLLSYDGLEWQEYNEKTGFTDDPVNVLFVSGEGQLYAATDNQLYLRHQNKWQPVLKDITIDFQIYAVKEVPGIGLMCATDKGLFWIVENKLTFYASPREKAFIKTLEVTVKAVEPSFTVSDLFSVNNFYVDEQNFIWLAVGYTNGMSGKIIKAKVGDDNGLEFFSFYSAPSDAVFNNGACLMQTTDGKIYLASNQHNQPISIFN